VRLDIYDLAGRRVRRLADAEYPAGLHSLVWDGRNDHGLSVGSGLYLYRWTAGNHAAARTMLLIR
jgi:flagellar hook assembly protein FlgD